jgi:hypothetical protein
MEMDMKHRYLPALTLVAAVMVACGNGSTATDPLPVITPTIFTAVGSSATVAAKADEFRTALGGSLNPPTVHDATSGRREINWDGVPAALTNLNTFPGDFFNVTSTRGALLSTNGTGLRVDSTAFSDISGTLPGQFTAFSPKKLFSSVGSPFTQVDFDLVGTTTRGLVNGFGVVFSDVDRLGSTRVVFVDTQGHELANIAAPAHLGTQQFSFVGAVFPSAIVQRVLIFSGDAALNATIKDVSDGGTKDLVTMDDFIYGEPRPE